MSKKIIDQLSGTVPIVESRARGKVYEARLELVNWRKAAEWLRAHVAMDHFLDITAVDYPNREPRFDIICIVRSSTTNERVHIRTQVAEGVSVPSLVDVWAGANWGEREVWDMFGIPFEGHPDLRRILMYDEFVGHPLLKDYPIDKAQPLVPYRDTAGIGKLSPFGIEEGQPWGRIRWEERLKGGDNIVAPAMAVQVGQRGTLSESEVNVASANPVKE